MPKTKHYAIILVVDSEKMSHEDVKTYIFQTVKNIIQSNYGYAVSDVYLDTFYNETPSEPPKGSIGE